MESQRSGGINKNNQNASSSNNNNNTSPKSSNNEPHIAPLHNKTPIRVTTSKSLQDIAKNTPILQRILPSQVEIVYHRKSGENELKRSKSRKTSKTVKQRDAIDPTSTLNESLNNQSAQVLDDTNSPSSSSRSSFLQSSSHEQSITITNDFEPHEDNTEPDSKSNNVSSSVVQNLQTRFDDSSSLLFNATTTTTTTCSTSNSINATSKSDPTPVTNQLEKEIQVHKIEPENVNEENKPVMEEKCVQTEDSGCSEGCLEIVTILNDSIEDMKLQIFNLNTRVNNLETTIKTEVEDLRRQRQNRLKSARVIAKDMKKMTDVVNSVEWIEIEKNVAQLLDRVKNSPAIVKKCPSSKESKIIHNANHKNLSQQETITNNNNNNNNSNQNALPLPIKS